MGTWVCVCATHNSQPVIGHPLTSARALFESIIKGSTIQVLKARDIETLLKRKRCMFEYFLQSNEFPIISELQGLNFSPFFGQGILCRINDFVSKERRH